MHSQTNIMKTHNFAKLCLKTRVTFLWTDKQLTQSRLPKTKSIFNSGTALLLTSTYDPQYWTFSFEQYRTPVYFTPLTISQKLNYMLHLHRPPVSIHSCQKTADTNKTWRKPKSVSMYYPLLLSYFMQNWYISIKTPFCNPWDSPLLYCTVLSANLTGKLKLL